MPSDKDIRRAAIEGETVESIAGRLGHSTDSVRGRISRATPSDRVALAKEIADRRPTVNSGLERQYAVVRRGMTKFAEKQRQLAQAGEVVTLGFFSDLHVPYTNWPAVDLAVQVLEYAQPDYTTAYNDFWDMTGYGKWPDVRSPASMLWGDDIENALLVSGEVYGAIRRAVPKTTLLQLAGNHDMWLFNFLRTTARTGFSEHNVADFMERLEDQGVLHFTNGENKRENIIQLSPGLKIVHGFSAAKNPAGPTSLGLSEQGVFFNTVAGHTHRSGITKINGVRHFNNGCLCLLDPSYLKFRPNWDTGVTIIRYDPTSRHVEGDVIDFYEERGSLVANYDGNRFEVKLI